MGLKIVRLTIKSEGMASLLLDFTVFPVIRVTSGKVGHQIKWDI